MMTDPISDMLARIRNAQKARHTETAVPASKLKRSLANVLQQNGYLTAVRESQKDGHPVLMLTLRYGDDGIPMIEGMQRISRPGCRVFVNAESVPKVRNGVGMAVLSTSKGVISDESAREATVGGEVLCEVW